MINLVKGTVSVIATVPLKASSVQVWIRYPCFCLFVSFDLWFLCKSDVRISCLLETWRNGQKKTFFRLRFQGCLCKSGFAKFLCIVGHLNITLIAVPFICANYHTKYFKYFLSFPRKKIKVLINLSDFCLIMLINDV